MGTTAEKLSYLNETKTQIKNALETPYNVFRDYPAMIKKYIDNQPTKIATNGICDNAVELPIVSLKSKGNNYQETTQGKNLFDNTLKDYAYYGNLAKTISTGVRLSVSSPITTSDIIFTVYSIMDLSNFVGKTVRMKATYKSNSALTGKYKIGLCDDKAGNRNAKASSSFTGQEISFIVPEIIEEQKYLAIWFYTNAGGTGATGDYVDYTNVIVTIDNEDMTYEPYTGGIPSPSPEYSQEIETINSIGWKQSGKNKFDNFKEYSYSNSNLNTTSLNNGIKIEKKSGFGLWVFDNLENLDGKIVRAKSKFNDGGSIAIGLASLDGTSRTVMKENTKSDTVSSFVIPKITDDKKYLAVWLYGTDNSEISYEDLIITIDNEDMTYEPYTGGIPSPSPEYSQEIETINSIGWKQSGKNKFDNFKEYSYSNSNLNTTSLNNGIKIEKKSGFGLWVFDNLENLDGKIVRAKSKFNDGGSIAIGLASLDGTSRTVMKENTKSDTVSSFVIPKITDDKKYLAVWLYGTDNSEISYEDLIITIDNEDMTYEPYHEPKVIEINLNGNTLAKVGDVKDILRVNRNGEVEIKKNIEKIVLTGSEKLVDKSSSTTRTYWGIDFSNYGLYQYDDSTKTCDILTTKFKSKPQQGSFLPGQVALMTDAKNVYFIFESDTTEEQARAILTDMPVYFRLAEPQTIKLSSISPIELWQGTNIFKLITNLETNFEVEYVVDKDSMLDEVQTAMLNAEIEI